MTPVLRALDDAELFDWLLLIRSENVGPRTFYGLLDRFGSARAAHEALPALARQSGARGVRLAARRDVEAEMQAAARIGARFLPVCDPSYPASLRAIDSAPPLLAVQGRLDVLRRPMVAIVGSRNASAGGLVFTERLAQGLGAAGHVVVSGLARGIDAKAHLASLATGTVGVLAGGHARIYPSEHVGLAARMAEDGVVLSEMPLTWEPRGRDFPRRNRIVSGLALGTVVVEAARRSGSLITARFAGEQGREVFAVPGSPLDPRAEGTNDLLRQGATLCTGVADVVDALAPMADREPPGFAERPRPTGEMMFWDESDASLQTALPIEEDEQPPGLDLRARLVGLLGDTPVSIDDLVRLTAQPAQRIQSTLLEMELDGDVAWHGAQGVARSAAQTRVGPDGLLSR